MNYKNMRVCHDIIISTGAPTTKTINMCVKVTKSKNISAANNVYSNLTASSKQILIFEALALNS